MVFFPLRKTWVNETSSNDRNCTSFWNECKIVSPCFPEYVKTEKRNIMSLASKMHLDIHLFAVCFCSSSHYFEMTSWSHNLLYIINPVHALLIKTICYLIWFVLIRRRYIIGHKAQMENLLVISIDMNIWIVQKMSANASFCLLVYHAIFQVFASLFLIESIVSITLPC